MCRAVVEGGRRCPCTRGDRRRAYQRLRYAARQAATAAVGEHTTATVDDPSSAEPSSLEQRCAETAAAVDEALTALRDADRSGDPDVHEAYLNAVLDHGAVLRDIADQKIERAYAAPHRRDRARALRKVGIGCARWLFGPIHGQGLRRNPPHRTVLLRHGSHHPRPLRRPQRRRPSPAPET